MSDYDEWESRRDDFDRKPVRTAAKAMTRVWVLVLVGLALVAAAGAGVWFVRVITSDTRGAGNAEIIKNEASNRIRAQEGFEDKFAAIVTADKNLTLTADALKSKPDDAKLNTELTGQKMICNDLVGQYNAAARKFTQEEFRAADLPRVIEETNPETNCKEN